MKMAKPLFVHHQQQQDLLSKKDDIHMHSIASPPAQMISNSTSVARNANNNEQEDDILEYDEENVVVIDLTEERNSSSKLRPNAADFTSSSLGDASTSPDGVPDVRYENYVINEGTTTGQPAQVVEIKREVYYDDSHLVSPPEPEDQSDELNEASDLVVNAKDSKNMENAKIQELLLSQSDEDLGEDVYEKEEEEEEEHEVDEDDLPTPSSSSPTLDSQEQLGMNNHANGEADILVAPPSQFSTSDDDTKGLTEDDIDRLFNQTPGKENEVVGDAHEDLENIEPPVTNLGEQMLWKNYQRYSQEEEKRSHQQNNHLKTLPPVRKVSPMLVRRAKEEEVAITAAYMASEMTEHAFNEANNHQAFLPSVPDTPLVASQDGELLERHRSHKKRSRKSSERSRDGSCPTNNSFNSTEFSLPKATPSTNCKRSTSCKRSSTNRPKTSDLYNMSSSVCNTLQRAHKHQERPLDTRYRGIVGRKAKSNDFLDRMDHTQNLDATSLHGSSLARKMTKIEKNLYLGNLEAATDVILLESHGITHIITVDSVPLPRKMTSMLPRIALLHLQVTDLPDEDLLSYFTTAIDFIEDCNRKGGATLIHCYRGRSRSATVMIAYLMHKHSYSAHKAISKVRSKRPSINPHDSFLAQLKLFEDMDFTIDPSNIQLKMFRLHCASEKMRKAKILFRDSLDLVMDEDPVPGSAGGSNLATSGVFSPFGSAGSSSGAKQPHHPMAYKCKRCRRTLATGINMLPHCLGESPSWLDPKWALPSEEVLEGASDTGLQLCSSTVFINPIRWMTGEIKAKLSGRLYCPNCQAKIGHYSWVMGRECGGSDGCGALVIPAFQLDVTEIIFRTKSKYLQSTGREPIVV